MVWDLCGVVMMSDIKVAGRLGSGTKPNKFNDLHCNA